MSLLVHNILAILVELNFFLFRAFPSKVASLLSVTHCFAFVTFQLVN